MLIKKAAAAFYEKQILWIRARTKGHLTRAPRHHRFSYLFDILFICSHRIESIDYFRIFSSKGVKARIIVCSALRDARSFQDSSVLLSGLDDVLSSRQHVDGLDDGLFWLPAV